VARHPVAFGDLSLQPVFFVAGAYLDHASLLPLLKPSAVDGVNSAGRRLAFALNDEIRLPFGAFDAVGKPARRLDPARDDNDAFAKQGDREIFFLNWF